MIKKEIFYTDRELPIKALHTLLLAGKTHDIAFTAPIELTDFGITEER